MRIRQIVEAAERGRTLGGFPIKVLNVEQGATDEGKQPGYLAPGWMLKQDPALAKKVKDAKQAHQELKKWAGKPVPKDVVEALKLDAPLVRLENTKPRLALVRASTVMQESSRP
jgi:hypothetical protein